MADRKGRKIGPQSVPARKDISESSPNPHGESNVIEMPIRTDQRHETGGKNVARTPSTVGGHLHPSVAHEPQPKAASLTNQPARARFPRQRKAAERDPLPRDKKEEKA